MSNERMPVFLKKRASLTPSRTALVFQGQRLTFKQLHEKSVEMSRQLYGEGLRKNEFVSVLLSNHLDTVIILFALQLLGVRAVILNSRLTANELSYQITNSQSTFIITELAFESLTSSDWPGVIFKEKMGQHSEVTPQLVDELSLDDICTVMYTSGTTGQPKGVMQTYGNHWWSAVGSSLNLGLHEDDAWLCVVPLFHISGYSILMRSVIYGMKVVLHDGFSAEKVLSDINAERVTIISVVSTMLKRILEKMERPLPDYFRCMLLGGGPAPLSMLEECKQKGVPVFQTYGMTETASQVVTLSPEYSVEKLGSAGRPLFPVQLKIVDRTGVVCEAYHSGEIMLKAANVTKGYLGHAPGSHLSEDGWFATGDIGYCDEDGFLFVQDRRSDLIISGGENVYPAEVEGVLSSHEHVVEAGVMGIEDAKWGQVPVAFVVGKGDFRDGYQLIEYCSARLAKYKVPRAIYFVAELPRNASQKLLRRKLAAFLPDEKGGETVEYR